MTIYGIIKGKKTILSIKDSKGREIVLSYDQWNMLKFSINTFLCTQRLNSNNWTRFKGVKK